MLDTITGTTRTEFNIAGIKVEGICICCDTDRATRRFNMLMNRAGFVTGEFTLDDQPMGFAQGYVGTHYCTDDLYAAINGFEITLVEGGVQFAPAEYRYYDEDWALEERWIELLPVIKWFFALNEEDALEAES